MKRLALPSSHLLATSKGKQRTDLTFQGSSEDMLSAWRLWVLSLDSGRHNVTWSPILPRFFSGSPKEWRPCQVCRSFTKPLAFGDSLSSCWLVPGRAAACRIKHFIRGFGGNSVNCSPCRATIILATTWSVPFLVIHTTAYTHHVF